jgi:hypothetical protein
MKNMSYRFIIALLLGAFLPYSASAWGTLGHRIVGEMSENLLSKNAKKRINAILGNASIAMVANWGDEVRSDSTYDYTNDWHYTNLNGGLTRTAFDTLALKQDNGKNIYSIVAITNHLKAMPNDTVMLKMLIHLVGDMHCPLHLGHAADRGGNSIQVTWFKETYSLHRLWDSGLIDYQKLSYTEYTTHLMRIHKLQNIPFSGKTSNVLDWAWEVYACTQTIYASAEEANKNYEYVYHYKGLLEENLVKAAEHLAALLNYIYR